MKGHFRCYVPRRFNAEKAQLIAQANDIINHYEEAGYVLTLRQLYYQFVQKGLLENIKQNYDKLGAVVSEGRLAGLISWTAIEDRTRSLKGLQSYDSPKQVLQAARDSYRRDLWAEQEWRPEVWVEKDALIGVIAPVANDLRIDYFACKGYNSQSEQWRAGQRFAGYVQAGQRPIVFHLGDHDPSGLDMTRDNRDRLSLFAGVPVTVVRLALNMDQIEAYKPPPNYAKVTDARFANYQREYGDESWELDALPPDVLSKLIRDAVMKVRDEGRWDESLRKEADELDTLDTMMESL